MEWISLREFMRRNKLGYEKAIQLITEGKVDYIKSENGTYRIKVNNDEKLSVLYEEALKEIERLKTKLSMLKQMINVD